MTEDISNEALVHRFCQDAVKVMERSVNGLPDRDQRKLMAGVLGGGEFEVRVRLRRDQSPRITVSLIDKDGEWHLVAGAGPSA